MDELLRIYLRDQLAVGIGCLELARRAARNNKDTEAGVALAAVTKDIEADVGTFREIMRGLGVAPDPVKNTAALVSERVGRLKLNGRLRGYSPLSRFVELEGLTAAIGGKKQMWTTLRDLAGLAGRLPGVDFDRLTRRADEQRDRLAPHRTAAGTTAFVKASHDV